MTRRRALLVAGVVVAVVLAVAAAVLFYRNSHSAPTGCDTVRAMLDDNAAFNSRAKDSAAKQDPGLVTDEQYRKWAARMKDNASRISEPDLAGKATVAADLSGRIADLVPRYRAKPDDKDISNDYINLGIEFGNAVNRLEYACLPAG
jgi:hypothetical protein